MLPLREEHGTLVLASESYIDPVSLAALARRLHAPVSYVLAYKGQVTVGLRSWYGRERPTARRRLLDLAVCSGVVGSARAATLWNQYVSRQVLLGEVLVALGHLDEVALRALLPNRTQGDGPLGEFLVGQGAITRQALKQALALQRRLQPSLATTLRRAGITTVTPALRRAV